MRAPIQLILALGSLAILIGMLAVGPRLLPPDPTLPNVAAMQGYNIGLAWILIFVWAVLVILLTSLPARTHAVEANDGSVTDSFENVVVDHVLSLFERS